MKNFYQYGSREHATHRLVTDPKTDLFYFDGSQFRATCNKSLPGYSLMPELLADLLGHLEKGDLDTQELTEQLVTRWRSTHRKLSCGGKIGAGRIRAIIQTILDSCGECCTSDALYVPYSTQHILLGFLCSKTSGRQDMIAYLERLKTHVRGISTYILGLTDCFGCDDLIPLAGDIMNTHVFERSFYTLVKATNYANVTPPQVVGGIIVIEVAVRCLIAKR